MNAEKVNVKNNSNDKDDIRINKLFSYIEKAVSRNDIKNILFTCKICKLSHESINMLRIHIQESHENNEEDETQGFKKYDGLPVEEIAKIAYDREMEIRNIKAILKNITENITEQDKCHAIVENNNRDKVACKTPSKNKRYKKIDGIELKKELKDEDIKHIVETVDEEDKLITETIFNPLNKNECREIISNIFKSISESRIYVKYIQKLKDIRINMLKWINMKEYENMLNDHVNSLRNIFISKSYDKLKIKKLIFESLTNLEKRIIKFGNYFNTQIDSEEIEKVRISLDNCMDFPKEYTVFNISFNKMQNYSLALFSLKKCLKSFLINKYGFNNLVYIKLSNTCEKDPHSFFYISKISKDDRYWTLDSRIEDISIELSNSLYPYCVELYRKIYYDSFSNHCYKYNYEYAIPNIYNELDQLAENMIILHNYESCRNILMDILKEFAQLYPTENDKINLKSPDSTQKAKFKEYNKLYDRNDIVRSLFTDYNEKVYSDFFGRFK